MSAIEQALRQIDEQAKNVVQEITSTANGPLSKLAETLPPPVPPKSYGSRVLLAGLAVVLLAGAWTLGKLANAPEDEASPAAANRPGTERAEVAARTAPSSPMAFIPDGGQTPELNNPPVAPARPAWHDEAAQVWSGGLKDEAARLWISGLRSEPPADLALMLAEQLGLAEADALYRQWADAFPLVVLKHANQEPGRWMVLAVPAAPDMESARQTLTQALGPRVQWGSFSHWMGRLALVSPASPTGLEPSPAQSIAPTDRPSVSGPPPASSPPRRALAPAVATPEATLAPVVAIGKAPVAPRETTSGAEAEVPELRRTATAEMNQGQGSPVAARAINTDFEALEKQLAEGQYAAALDGIARLEKVVGENWRTRYLTGVALSGLGRWPEAATALSEAHRLNPGHVRLALYLSVAQQELGEHTGAIATLALLQEKHAEVPEVSLNQGHSYQALGRSQEARAAYQRFVALSAGRAEMQAQRNWALGQIADIK